MSSCTSSDSDDSQESMSSESFGSEAGDHGFLDLEALESPDFEEYSSDSTKDEVDPFPFLRLPVELRLRIWELLCPELCGKPRVFSLAFQESLAPFRFSDSFAVGSEVHLEDSTLEMRCVLAVHRESRAFAEKRFPDTLLLESTNGQPFSLRLHLNRDIVHLNQFPDPGMNTPCGSLCWKGFSDRVINLALPLSESGIGTFWLNKFPFLKRLFFYVEDDDYIGRYLKDEAVRWCTSSNVCQYYQRDIDISSMDAIYCWPDVIKHPVFTETHVPKLHIKFLSYPMLDDYHEAQVALYPMVLFNNDESIWRFEKLSKNHMPLKVYSGMDNREPDAESDTESHYDSYPYEFPEFHDLEVDEDGLPYDPTFLYGGYQGPWIDDYESEGIDDDEPEIFAESGDEHLDDVESDSHSDSETLSSDRETSETMNAAEAVELSINTRKRRIVTDTDDEEDDLDMDNRPAKRLRARVRVVRDSDDDQDDNGHVTHTGHFLCSFDDKPVSRGRCRITTSDEVESLVFGGEEDEEDEEEKIQSSLGRMRHDGENQLQEEDDENDEDDFDDDDDDDGGGGGGGGGSSSTVSESEEMEVFDDDDDDEGDADGSRHLDHDGDENSRLVYSMASEDDDDDDDDDE